MPRAALKSDQAGAHPPQKPPRKYCHYGHAWKEPHPADARLTCAGCGRALPFRDINVATFAQILGAVARRGGPVAEERFQVILYDRIRDALGLAS